MSLKVAHFCQVTSAAGTLAGTPYADFAEGSPISDTVSMAKYNKAYFIMYWGAVTSSPTETLTVVPITKVGGSTTTAIPFRYKHVTTPDTNTAWTAASTVATIAGASGMCIIEVNAEDLPIGYEYCYLNIAELSDNIKLGGVIIIMDEPRYAQDVSEVVTA